MVNRLATAVSPYLRSHADNPVDWWPWGEDAFAEATRRDVPVLVSIGYSTCHWCHVMARESFSDPELAGYLNDRFVSIKVDREEHPDVDSAYLAAASAFTQNLGWPLTVFATPGGKVFYAGTYFPPQPVGGHPSFRQVLDAVMDAWNERRADVEQGSHRVASALADAARGEPGDLPDLAELSELVTALAAHEDREFGGFGSAPKFPVVPVLDFLLAPASDPDKGGVVLAERTLQKMAASPLRDPIEGGFFRYATRRDWSVPHYERMLYDNAGLLGVTASLAQRLGSQQFGSQPEWLVETAQGLARYPTDVMQLPSGGFASAQDSESLVNGERSEGGYYALDAGGRAEQPPPRLDEKVLTGWNGMAIGALAEAAFVFDEPSWLDAAQRAARFVLDNHVLESDVLERDVGGSSLQAKRLARASLGGELSAAHATLEDYGMFAGGLLRLAVVSGDETFAVIARTLIDSVMDAAPAGAPFAVPEGADPVLAARGLAIAADPSEGAYPSGLSATADAAYVLYVLTADSRYLEATHAALALVATPARSNPVAFGAALRLMAEVASEPSQLVVVTADPESANAANGNDERMRAAARGLSTTVTAVVSDAAAQRFAHAGFELFAEKSSRGAAIAYWCRDFTCRLPTTEPSDLAPSQTRDG